MSDTANVNVYTCESCGHERVTVDRDKGVTPMFMTCPDCGGRMRSAMYQCDQSRVPTHEWVRPTPRQSQKSRKHEREYFRKGGLDIRSIAS